MEKTQAYFLRNNSDWAFVSIIHKVGFAILIHSSYGSWSYTWTHPGESYIEFLETADESYTFSKFCNTAKYGASRKVQERERTDYLEFYKRFWLKLIEQLKNNNLQFSSQRAEGK